MNYYIRGDKERAEEIKAAFKKMGFICTLPNCVFDNENLIFLTSSGVVYSFYIYQPIYDIIKTHPDYKELKLPIQPKFKVGDWIVHIDGNSYVPLQVYGLKEDRYLVTNMLGSKGKVMLTWQDKWRLWSIADAKDGDVLVGHEVIVLFKEIDGLNIRCHFSYHYMNTPMVFTNQLHNKMAFRPATKDERELIFAKMKEEGYEWDADKKELKKTKPHYDISRFYAGMPVLVRDDDDEEWNYLFFSHYRKKSSDHFFAGGNPWFQCIPFGEDTKHLLGTTDMCPEEYINW